MKIAITCWGKRVSPLFDTAQRLLIVELEGREVISRQILEINDNLSEYPLYKAKRLAGLGIEILICGGISTFFYYLLAGWGVEVIPWITGELEDVLKAFQRNQLHLKKFAMPGCWKGRHRFRGGFGKGGF